MRNASQHFLGGGRQVQPSPFPGIIFYFPSNQATMRCTGKVPIINVVFRKLSRARNHFEETIKRISVLLVLVLCCAVLRCAVLSCPVLCCAVLCCAAPCRAVPCRAVLCCAVLCRAVPCRAVLCMVLCCSPCILRKPVFIRCYLLQVRDLSHQNLNPFVGVCITSPNICIVSQFCHRGSLEVSIKHDCVLR